MNHYPFHEDDPSVEHFEWSDDAIFNRDDVGQTHELLTLSEWPHDCSDVVSTSASQLFMEAHTRIQFGEEQRRHLFARLDPNLHFIDPWKNITLLYAMRTRLCYF